MSKLSTTDLITIRLLNRRPLSTVSSPLKHPLPPPPCESENESSIPNRLLTILSQPNWQRSPSLKSLVPKITPSHLSSIFSSSQGLHPTTAINFNFWISQNPNFKPRQQHSVHAYATLINFLVSNGYLGVVYKLRLKMINSCVSVEDALFVLDLCRKMNNKEESKHKLAIVCYNTLLNALAKFGLVDEMKSLYIEMLQNKVSPNVITYNKMVNGYCKVGNVAEAKRYFDKIVEEGLDPDFFTYTSLIFGYCQRKDLDSAFKVFKEMGLKGIVRNDVAYNYLIHGLCEAKRVDEAMELFTKMKEEEEEGCSPTVRTYTVLINALYKSGQKSEALGLLKEMSEKGIEPNEHTYTVLIHSSCGDCEMGEARGLLDRMLKKGLMPNVITYNALIDGYCKQGNVEEALEVVVLMESRKLCPNTRTYNELINGFCKKNIHKAMSLLSKMLEKRVSPNVVTYNSLIEGQCRSGNFDSAYRLLSEMSERGLAPDQRTYNSFIDCLCKKKRVEEARALFDSLEEKGVVKANVVMYTALIDGYCKSNNLEEARLMLVKMLSKECLPNSSTFNALIHGLCIDGKLEEASLLEERMVKMGLQRTITTDTILIHRLLKEGDFDKAKTRFQTMLSSLETKPDVHTYTSFIQAYCSLGRVEEAVEMMEKMKENGVEPDSITYSSLITCYGDLGMTDSAFNVLKLMVDNKCEPSIDTFLSLLKHLHETKHGKDENALCLIDFDIVLDLLEKMAEHGVKPEAKTYEKIILGFSRNGNLITAEKVLDHMRLHEGLTPSENVLNAVLTCCCKGEEEHYDKADRLVDDMLEVGYLPNLESCKILICGLYKSGEGERGREIFEKMVRLSDYSRDELAWKILVDGVGKMGLVDVFYELFGLMEKNGCKFSSHTYQLLIKGPS